MAEGGSLKEFLVKLGFQVDEQGESRFDSALEKAQLKAEVLSETLKELAKKAYESFSEILKDYAQIGFLAQKTGASVEVLESFAYRMEQSGLSHAAGLNAIASMASKLHEQPGLGKMIGSWTGSEIIDGKITQENLEALTEKFREWNHEGKEYLAFNIGKQIGLDHDTVHAMATVVDTFTEEYEKKVHHAGLDEKGFAEKSIKFHQMWKSMTTSINLLFESVAAGVVSDGDKGLVGFIKFIDKHSEEITRTLVGIAKGIGFIVDHIVKAIVWVEKFREGFEPFGKMWVDFVLILFVGSMVFGTSIGVIGAFALLIVQLEAFDKAKMPKWFSDILTLAEKFLGSGGAAASESGGEGGEGGEGKTPATQANIGAGSSPGMLSRAWGGIKSAFGFGGGGGSSGGGGKGGGDAGKGEFNVQKTYDLAIRNGATPEQARHLAAIAQAESSGNPNIINDVGRDRSVGLWQINQLTHGDKFGTREQLKDPDTNAKAAIALMNARIKRGEDPYKDWSTHNNGAYLKYMPTGNVAGYNGASTGGDTPSGDALDKAKKLVLAGGSKQDVQRFMGQQGYNMDTNWCGDFAGSVIKSVGGTPPAGAPIASNWLHWGKHIDPSDIKADDKNIVAVRTSGGVRYGATGSHVTFADPASMKNGSFTGWGGNQGAGRFSPSKFNIRDYEFRQGAFKKTLGTEDSHTKEVDAGTQNNVSQQIHINGNTVAKAPTTGKPSDDVQEHKDSRTISNLTGAGVVQ
jgi:hypothetical protein